MFCWEEKFVVEQQGPFKSLGIQGYVVCCLASSADQPLTQGGRMIDGNKTNEQEAERLLQEDNSAVDDVK